MILDSSAIIAVLENEPERAEFQNLVSNSDCHISACTYLETSIVLLRRRGESSFSSLDAWLEGANVAVVPSTESQARIARQAYARFGKGRHPAGLNFGDCASYALAMERGDSLLFQGEDFSKTDVKIAGRT